MEREKLIEILQGKGLSTATIQAYAYYSDALNKILTGTGRDLDQEVINAFISTFKGASPCRAFLKILFEAEHRTDLEIPQYTGSRRRKKRTYIQPEEIKTMAQWMLRHKSSVKYFLMLNLAYECALRRKEVVEIRVDDFQWAAWKEDPSHNGKLKISVEGAKGKKERYVIVPAWLMKGLYAFISEVQHRLDDQDRLFGIDIVRWHQVFKEAALEALQKKKLSLHDLRFSKATYWYRNGVDIRRIKIRLGHSRIETTYRYIDPAEEEELSLWQKTG